MSNFQEHPVQGTPFISCFQTTHCFHEHFVGGFSILKKYSSLIYLLLLLIKSSPTEVFSEKAILKLCCKFTGEKSYGNMILIKLHCNFNIFNKITIPHECFSVNLLHFSERFFLGTILVDGFRLMQAKTLTERFTGK